MNVAWTEQEIKAACRHAGITEHMILRIKAYLPVHTHPVKELTDEEIKQIFLEQTGFYFDDNPADDLALMDFAREILRKAQEK